MNERPQVLLVEDHDGERRLLYHSLKRDFDVFAASNASEAWTIVTTTKIEAAILDMHLPPDTRTARAGVRLCRRLRELNDRLPIVVTTSDTDSDLATQLEEIGVDRHLAKPVDPVALRRAVMDALHDR